MSWYRKLRPCLDKKSFSNCSLLLSIVQFSFNTTAIKAGTKRWYITDKELGNAFITIIKDILLSFKQKEMKFYTKLCVLILSMQKQSPKSVKEQFWKICKIHVVKRLLTPKQTPSQVIFFGFFLEQKSCRAPVNPCLLICKR